MIELARYHLDQDHEYVPLGKTSTDPLEKEFGKLRLGSGGTYFITVQQILEKVSINKTKLLLTLNCSLEDFIEAGHKCPKSAFLPTDKVCDVFDKLYDLEKSLDHDTKSALVHIAGYVVRHDDENVDGTKFYFKNFGSFTSYLNRGKLNIPGDSACQWVFFFVHHFSRGFSSDL